MSPEKGPFQKENNLPTIILWDMLVLGGEKNGKYIIIWPVRDLQGSGVEKQFIYMQFGLPLRNTLSHSKIVPMEPPNVPPPEIRA